MSGNAAEGADLFGSDDIILLHETISLREDGKDVFIKLHAQQYNQHPKDIGEEKAGQLSDTDVLAEKFPNKFVH